MDSEVNMELDPGTLVGDVVIPSGNLTRCITGSVYSVYLISKAPTKARFCQTPDSLQLSVYSVPMLSGYYGGMSQPPWGARPVPTDTALSHVSSKGVSFGSSPGPASHHAPVALCLVFRPQQVLCLGTQPLTDSPAPTVLSTAFCLLWKVGAFSEELFPRALTGSTQ